MSDEKSEAEEIPEDMLLEEADSEIGALLDLGYEQLDGFVDWLEEQAGVSTRIAQQDCFNAEFLLDYLANQYRKSISEINEFELRWFLFSHYIRKAMADAETEERLPDSLLRFFAYLNTEHSLAPPTWALSVLDDRAYYLKRRRDFVELDGDDERAWEEGFSLWTAELEEDLDLRCLWLPRDLGGGIERAEVTGWREATLTDEANRHWQTEREELLRTGLDYDTIRERLTDSYLRWVSTPQDRLEGQTPREVILAERQERVEE